MIVFPNCKINLGLQVLRKRTDGYHDISTIFYPIPLTDSLELITDITVGEPIIFTSSGLDVGPNPGENLCVQAFNIIKSKFPELPPVRLHLHKVIPMGAGLGGGSSDAAFTLKLLNRKYQLGIADDTLKEYALELGSDCPFFIDNHACMASGRGEKMHRVNIDLSMYSMVLVYPGIHISTAWAFSEIEPSASHWSMEEFISTPVARWKDMVVNDFEAPVARRYPQIAAIKQKLYSQGAVFASMTGSGSAVYGLFEHRPDLQSVFEDSYRVFIF